MTSVEILSRSEMDLIWAKPAISLSLSLTLSLSPFLSLLLSLLSSQFILTFLAGLMGIELKTKPISRFSSPLLIKSRQSTGIEIVLRPNGRYGFGRRPKALTNHTRVGGSCNIYKSILGGQSLAL